MWMPRIASLTPKSIIDSTQVICLARAAIHSAATTWSSVLIETETFVSKAQRDNKLRYFVAQNQPAEALSLLHRSVHKVPVTISAGPPRFLKTPNPSVCNKVLAAASHDASLLEEAAKLAVDIQHMTDTVITAETEQKLLVALARASKAESAVTLMEVWLAKQEEALGDDKSPPGSTKSTLDALLHSSAKKGDLQTSIKVLSGMADLGLSPTTDAVLLLAKVLQQDGKYLASQQVLSWLEKHQLMKDT